MENFTILVDSSSDLEKEYREKYGITLVYSHLAVDGKDTKARLDWDGTSAEEFYSSLKANPDRYKTSPPSVGEMAAAMEEAAKNGVGIMYITLSSGLSGTYNFAQQAKKCVCEKYPEARIECVDSLRFGPAIGLMAINASILRSEGKSLEETAEILNSTKNRYHQAGWLDDLSFVAKQGRLTHAKAFFGTLIGVKPLGEFDYNGLTTVIAKAKGERKALETVINYIKETVTEPENQIFIIAQTKRLPQAEKLKKLIEENIKPKDIYIKDVYPSCGVNIGPGLMAAYYIGKEISKDLSFERNTVKKYLEEKNNA